MTTVEGIVNALRLTYRDLGVAIWMNAPNRWLDGRPAVELLDTAEGRERVKAAVLRIGDATEEDFR